MTGGDLGLEISGNPGEVWHVGFAPDVWTWAPWRFANDEGLFGGRWDDQQGQFRTLYTADSLLGCLLELLARFRPAHAVTIALDEIEDDGTIGRFPDAPEGTVGYSWLNDRGYGRARQRGSYCYITYSRSLAALQSHYPLDRHGLRPSDVDTALLKDAEDRVLTRSVARWLYDLQEGGRPLVDGVRFNSRHGDELGMWAVFERAEDEARSSCLEPSDEQMPVTPDLPELQEVFRRFGLRWHED